MLAIAGVAVLGLSLAACSGEDGAAGSAGNSCSVETAADSTTTVTCGTNVAVIPRPRTARTAPTARNGADGVDGVDGTA
jgi:hypothetical protein